LKIFFILGVTFLLSSMGDEGDVGHGKGPLSGAEWNGRSEYLA